MKILLIHNPRSGHGRGGRTLPKLQARFRAQGCEVDVLSTHHPGHGTLLVQESRLDAYDGVVAAGGDGTIHEVLTGYFRNPGPRRPPLGVIPVGTGNAFVREMGLVGPEWEKAVDIVTRGETRVVDVARFTTCGEVYHSLNILGVGFVSDANETAIRLKFLGNSAYVLAVLYRLLGLRTYRLRLTVDGSTESVDACFATVSNSRYTGTTFLMAPDAKLDDGLLDLVVLKGISRMRVVRIFKTIFTGEHVREPEVVYRQARKVTLELEDPRVLNVDGEILGRTPVEVECLPGALTMFW